MKQALIPLTFFLAFLALPFLLFLGCVQPPQPPEASPTPTVTAVTPSPSPLSPEEQAAQELEKELEGMEELTGLEEELLK